MDRKTYSISITATDFQKIPSIPEENIKATDGFTWDELFSSAETPAVIGHKIALAALEIMLTDASNNDNEILVGRSFVGDKNRRISNNNNSIKLIHWWDSQPVIGGIVGAISGTVSADEIIKKIDEDISLDKSLFFNINLQVRSRMDTDKSWYFLFTILEYGNLMSHSHRVFESEDEAFDFLLTDLLANSLRSALPKGHYRTYQRFEKNNDRLKGTIDIARHIRLNAGQDSGAIAYSYRENSIDNKLNRLLLVAYLHLKRKYPELVERKIDCDNALREYLNVMRYQIDTSRIDARRTLIDNASPISHPFYTEYEDIRKICIRILRDIGVSVFDTPSGVVNGFLYYLPDLWEDFLESAMRDKFGVGCNLLAQEEYGYVSKENSGYVCTGRPDFVISAGGKTIVVLDAKFKPGWKDCSVHDKASDIDKCIRDMVVVNAEGTGIIYPYEIINLDDKNKLQDAIVKRKRIISKVSNNYFVFYPVGVPKSDSYTKYDSWKKEFRSYVDNFLQIVDEDLRNFP